MTVIAAIHDQDETWIGSDTMWVYGGSKLFEAPKWVVRGSHAIGVAGARRTIDLCGANAERLFDGVDGPVQFVDRLHALLAEAGYERNPNERGRDFGEMFIYADVFGVCAIGTSGGTIKMAPGTLWADGSGDRFAIGAGAALAGTGTPEERLHRAIEIAIAHDDGCGGEPWIHRLGDN